MPNRIVPGSDDQHGPPVGILEAHVDAFVSSLSARGYTAVTVRPKRQIAASFARWTRRKRLPIALLDESHVATFLRNVPRRSKFWEAVRRRALRLLLEHLRAGGEIPTPAASSDHSPAAVLQERYERHLRKERGLSERSLAAYRPFVRQFLADRVTTAAPGVAGLKPRDVQDFILDRIKKRPSESMKLQTTALRSFLRFLFLSGETPVDLSLAVPTVRQWRQATVHTFLSPDEVEQVLQSCDHTSLVGRRDHAVLILLARLGLRAGEVVALELSDISWRTGEILVRGKGGVHERLPLLPDVGEALARYLQDARGRSASRRVFVRMPAPRVGFTTQTAVGAIARRAIARAGLHPLRSGAHLFRHSLATTMIRHGASMGEIGEVLRHRSRDTTEIYAKVDFESLRAVALPWPATGGGR